MMIGTSVATLYLDVDGVLNRFGWRKSDPSGWGDFVDHPNVNGFNLNLSRNMGAALNDLDVEIVWCTTWERAADKYVADLVGLPRGLRVLPLGRGWKYQAVCDDILRDPTDFVWIDDDAIFGYEDDVCKFADSLDIDCLPIITSPNVGITKLNVDAIRYFLTAVSESA